VTVPLHSLLTRTRVPWNRGAPVIAVGRDLHGRARSPWGLNTLTLWGGPDRPGARQWELDVDESASHGMASPGLEAHARASEPGMSPIRPEHTLFCGRPPATPFARPAFRDLRGTGAHVVAPLHPERAEVVDF
jgi:hypothetical protein